MRARLCLTLGAAAALFACAHGGTAEKKQAEQKSLAWYHLPAGGYSVLMPSNVTREEKTAQTADGPVQIHIAQATPSGTGESFLVSYAQLPPSVLQKTSTPALLDGLQGGTMKQVGGNLTSSRDIVEDGMQGREFEANKPGEGKMRARVLVGNDGVYSLVATYVGNTAPEDVNRFLNSLSRQPGAAAPANGQQQNQPPPPQQQQQPQK